MTKNFRTPNSPRIAELNDRARTLRGVIGRLYITKGISALPFEDQIAIRLKVMTFDRFSEGNDPHGEHDFGVFDHNGQKIFWKIDYYSDDTFTEGSADPSDETQTERVLTIMLAAEY